MRQRRVLAASITICIVFLFPLNALPLDRLSLSPSPLLNHLPGELLVKYKPQAAHSAITSSLSRVSSEIQKRHAGFGIHHVKLPLHHSVDDALRLLNSDPSVEYAEPNYVRHVTSTVSSPNDTFFPRQWGLHNTGQNVNGTAGTSGDDIHAPEAWDITKGNSAIVIAVIDSGVDYNHPDLAGNISSTLRFDFVDDDNYPMDANDHGTHVTGTIAAIGNNNAGIAGVCWTGTIMPLRAGDTFGTLRVSDIVSAIDYAIAKGARIINGSYRGDDFSQAEYDAINNAKNAGILLVAAAGNEANNNDTRPGYPASYALNNIISVAATDQNDNLASFSNYGARSVHVAAPGVNIYSARPARQILWSTGFDSGSIGDWTTDGTWGLTTGRQSSSAYSLTVNPAGNYLNSSDQSARAPVRDLSSALGSKLEFVFIGRSEANYDILHVETSTDGTDWTDQDIFVIDANGSYVDTYANGLSGNLSDQWYGATVDLGGYDGRDTVHIRFRFTSDDSVTYTGWFIDDIRVTAASPSYAGTEYRYLSGTSMATPHVTGLAALIWGLKPSLTYAQVRSIILSSVDTRSSLVGKTVSGGRINAFNALFYVTPEAPVSAAAEVLSSSAVKLTWIDDSPNESGFRIERKTGSGAYAPFATVDQNTTTYSDTGLSASTTYCYRVAAFNNGGNSPYTGEVCATTGSSSTVGDTGGISVGAAGGGGGGGCFIATAAFGSPLESHVQILRDFRDRYLVRSEAGKLFIVFYCRISPSVAQVISRSDILRVTARWCLMPWVGAAYAAVNHGQTTAFFFLMGGALLIVCLFRRFSRRGGAKRSGSA